MKSLAIGAFAIVAAGAAAAQPVPPPATIDDAGVTAWIKTHLKTDGWTLIGADGSAVVFGSPDGVRQGQDKTLTTQVRHEYYRTLRLGDFESRSNLQTWDVDCAGRQMRILDMAIFEHNNLTGRSQARSWSGPPWEPVDMSSTRGRTIRRICDAPTTGQRLN